MPAPKIMTADECREQARRIDMGVPMLDDGTASAWLTLANVLELLADKRAGGEPGACDEWAGDDPKRVRCWSHNVDGIRCASLRGHLGNHGNGARCWDDAGQPASPTPPTPDRSEPPRGYSVVESLDYDGWWLWGVTGKNTWERPGNDPRGFDRKRDRREAIAACWAHKRAQEAPPAGAGAVEVPSAEEVLRGAGFKETGRDFWRKGTAAVWLESAPGKRWLGDADAANSDSEPCAFAHVDRAIAYALSRTPAQPAERGEAQERPAPRILDGLYNNHRQFTFRKDDNDCARGVVHYQDDGWQAFCEDVETEPRGENCGAALEDAYQLLLSDPDGAEIGWPTAAEIRSGLAVDARQNHESWVGLAGVVRRAAQPEPAREPAAGGVDREALGRLAHDSAHRGEPRWQSWDAMSEDTREAYRQVGAAVYRRGFDDARKGASSAADARYVNSADHATVLRQRDAARAELAKLHLVLLEASGMHAADAPSVADATAAVLDMRAKWDATMASNLEMDAKLAAATAEGERLRAMVTQQRDAAVALLSAAAASGRGESTDVPARLELQLRMVAEAASAALSLLAPGPAPGVSERAAGKEGA